MFGVLIRPTLRSLAGLAVKRVQAPPTSEITRKFSQLSIQPAKPQQFSNNLPTNNSILLNPDFLKLTTNPAFTQVRTVTKFSLKTGKRKSVHAVLKRFKRLDWGIWIRTKAARHKRIWKKDPPARRKARQHIFCNSTQSWMLDKMVTTFWRKPKHYVDDPYQPYQTRENFWRTRRKPIEWD